MNTGDKTPVVCCLGRYGDICNALPIAYDIYTNQGIKPKFVVSKEFWKILEAVDYVQPVVWDLPYSDLPRAITRLEGKHEIICQSYMHTDDRRLTDSYQKESWRLAGYLDKFGNIPLVFDRRNKLREGAAIKRMVGDTKKKIMLVVSHGVSSPFDFNSIYDEIVKRYSDEFFIFNMGGYKMDAIYDVLGFLEIASVLVTIDTMHLHMSRATHTPTVAIVNNGWFGSVPHEYCVGSVRYADATKEKVLELIESAIK